MRGAAIHDHQRDALLAAPANEVQHGKVTLELRATEGAQPGPVLVGGAFHAWWDADRAGDVPFAPVSVAPRRGMRCRYAFNRSHPADRCHAPRASARRARTWD